MRGTSDQQIESLVALTPEELPSRMYPREAGPPCRPNTCC